MRDLLDQLTESKFKPRTWLKVKEEHIEHIAEMFAMSENDMITWTMKIINDNAFMVMSEPADEGHVFVDYNGDEFEAPEDWFEPADNAPETFGGTGRYGTPLE